MKGIADTGFVVAFGNRDDHYHAWASDIAKTITEPLLDLRSGTGRIGVSAGLRLHMYCRF